MSAVNGLNGRVIMPAGFTLITRGWNANITDDEQSITPLNPENEHESLLGADGEIVTLLKGASGRFHGKLPISTAALLTGSGYDYNPEAWALFSSCEARETTPLGAEWKTFLAGLKKTRIETSHYIDSAALPVSGVQGTAVLVCDAGQYTCPYIVHEVTPEVDLEGDSNQAPRTLVRAGCNFPTAVGLPLAGVLARAQFQALSGKLYGGDILLTQVVVRVNRRTSTGSYEVDWVASDEFAPESTADTTAAHTTEA